MAGKLRILDLFCGAGGASEGYARAGFEVVGVDIKQQPNYPFEFWWRDALDAISGEIGSINYNRFHAIHASPPCQRFSDLAKRNGNADDWPDFIWPIRRRLVEWGGPWIMENVEGAPLMDPIRLCGTMFPPLRVIRHRLFESNVALVEPAHPKHPLVFTHDKRKAHYGKLDQNTSFVQVTGGGNATIANKRAAMGIAWMTGAEINEAIPPAYTEYLGAQLLAALKVEEAAA